MGNLSRIRFGGGPRRDVSRDFRSSLELVERARAAAKRWEEEADERAERPPEPEAPEESPEPSSEPGGDGLSSLEAAVDDALRRMRRESERLRSETEARFAGLEKELARQFADLAAASERQAEAADRLATEFSRLYNRFHPASSHLAELQARVKALAGELTAGQRAAEEPD